MNDKIAPKIIMRIFKLKAVLKEKEMQNGGRKFLLYPIYIYI